MMEGGLAGEKKAWPAKAQHNKVIVVFVGSQISSVQTYSRTDEDEPYLHWTSAAASAAVALVGGSEIRW